MVAQPVDVICPVCADPRTSQSSGSVSNSPTRKPGDHQQGDWQPIHKRSGGEFSQPLVIQIRQVLLNARTERKFSRDAWPLDLSNVCFG